MTPKNSVLAETLKVGGLLNTCATYIDFFQTGEQQSSISDTPASTNTFYALVICNQGPHPLGITGTLTFVLSSQVYLGRLPRIN